MLSNKKKNKTKQKCETFDEKIKSINHDQNWKYQQLYAVYNMNIKTTNVWN